MVRGRNRTLIVLALIGVCSLSYAESHDEGLNNSEVAPSRFMVRPYDNTKFESLSQLFYSRTARFANLQDMNNDGWATGKCVDSTTPNRVDGALVRFYNKLKPASTYYTSELERQNSRFGMAIWTNNGRPDYFNKISDEKRDEIFDSIDLRSIRTLSSNPTQNKDGLHFTWGFATRHKGGIFDFKDYYVRALTNSKGQTDLIIKIVRRWREDEGGPERTVTTYCN